MRDARAKTIQSRKMLFSLFDPHFNTLKHVRAGQEFSKQWFNFARHFHQFFIRSLALPLSLARSFLAYWKIENWHAVRLQQRNNKRIISVKQQQQQLDSWTKEEWNKTNLLSNRILCVCTSTCSCVSVSVCAFNGEFLVIVWLSIAISFRLNRIEHSTQQSSAEPSRMVESCFVLPIAPCARIKRLKFIPFIFGLYITIYNVVVRFARAHFSAISRCNFTFGFSICAPSAHNAMYFVHTVLFSAIFILFSQTTIFREDAACSPQNIYLFFIC